MKWKDVLPCLLLIPCVDAAAQHSPGGVGDVSLWSCANAAIVDTVRRGAVGITAFQVVVPTTDGENATLMSGALVATSRRVAEPNSGQYVNFAGDAPINVPRVISLRRRVADSDTASVAVSELPLTANSDSVCESIVYGRMLSNRDRQKVDTYLALKYGVTLDQTAPASYVSPDGRIVWDAVGNAQYSHHMAGLCNDTVSRLYKPAAVNAESAGLLRLAVDTVAPASYVICGDDDGPLRYIRGDGQPKRLMRSWRISASGDVPKLISLSLNAGSIQEAHPLRAGEHYWLTIDDTAYVKSADLGALAARFDSVPVRDGMTLAIVAARGDEEPENEDSPAAEDDIYAVSVAPNPTTDGRVSLRIRLREAAPVTISLYAPDGHPYATRSRSGSDFYNVRLALPSHGVWIATVECGEIRRPYKLISK